MTALPTRQQIDAAEPLNFEQRRAAKAELGIVIKCRINGFDCELNMTGDVDQLKRITSRLAELGAEPSAPITVAPAAQPARGKAERVEPEYDGDGDPCCPVHRRKLSEGNFGLFCSAKAKDGQAADKKGYCGLKFKD